jgi:hypothetical protein
LAEGDLGVAWGNNGMGQCDVPSPNSGFVGISAGMQFSLGLKSDGSVVGWGENVFYRAACAPTAASAVAAGRYHSLGLKPTEPSWPG